MRRKSRQQAAEPPAAAGPSAPAGWLTEPVQAQAGRWPSARADRGAGGVPGAHAASGRNTAGPRPKVAAARPGPAVRRPGGYGEPYSQVSGDLEAEYFRPNRANRRAIRQIDGALGPAKGPLTGRYDAEWCSGRARVRRNSLLRTRRRESGGAMAAGDEAVPGARVPSERAHSRQRRGAGGRWLIWTLRVVVWAALLIIAYRGVAAIVTGSPKTSQGTTPPVASSASGFPTSLAEAYALQFGNVYLNFSPATAAQRASELAAFLPPGTAPQLGWNGAGSQLLQSEDVASITVQNSHHAIVTLLTLINGHMMKLGVPIYSADGAMVISGEPALLPAPARVAPPQPQSTATDPTTQAALTSQLPAFFQAYASGDQTTLDRFLASGAQVTGLGGAVTFSSISQMYVPVGGTTRHIAVTVVWNVAGTASKTRPAGKSSAVSSAPAGVEMTYEMTVVQQGGSWYVKAIGASTQASGPP